MSLTYLSTAAAAKAIGVSASTMKTYIDEGHVRYTDIGRNGRPRIRISEDDLRAFMEARARTTTASVA